MAPCCGQPLRTTIVQVRIPANPKVRDPVRMLYLGGKVAEFVGGASGNRYHVAPHRRDFSVERDDADAMLCRRDVILAPGEKPESKPKK